MEARQGNSVLVAGTVTRDAEYRTVGEHQTPLVKFSLAVNGRNEIPAFANCAAFGNTLANYAQGVRKGDSVLVAGIIETSQYKGKTYNDVNCQWLNILGKSDPAYSPFPPPASRPANVGGQPPASGYTTFDDEPVDDEVPF